MTVAGPHLAASLGDDPARSRLYDTARHLPADSLGVGEVRLAADEPEVDLSVRLSRPEQARQLAGQLPWPHLQDLLSRWAEGEWEQVPTLWLEFDLDREAADLPLPILCAQLPPETDPLWLADSLLPALYGRALGAAQRETVLLCAREVLPPGRLLYAFSLLSRGAAAVRLEILGLDAAGMGEYLERVAPHVRPTAAALAPLLAGTEKPHLSFDVGDIGGMGVLPRIGLEGAFPRQPPREPRWTEILDRLVDQGLCSPAKREAVLAWPGHDSFWTAPALWPVAEMGMGGFCVRFLSHLKVVGRPHQPPQAKAYLGFGHLQGPAPDPP